MLFRSVARQVPLSVGFSRQQYWSGLPFPSPGNLPYTGIESESHALAGRFFITEPPGKPPYSREDWFLGGLCCAACRVSSLGEDFSRAACVMELSSLVAQRLKRLPAMQEIQETQVRSMD